MNNKIQEMTVSHSSDPLLLLPQSWHKGHKYYNIHLQPNLFGGVSLIKSWGAKNSKRAGYEMIYCNSKEEVAIALATVIKRRKLRGYRPYNHNTVKLPSEKLLKLVASLEGSSSINRLKQLIKPELDINVRDHEGYTALHWAAYVRKTEVAATLITCRADLDIRDYRGCTSLMESCWKGHIEMVKMLLKYGAGVNLKSNKSHTALTLAILGKHPEVVRLLLKAGADTNVKDREGKTILEYAVDSKNLEIIELIKENKHLIIYENSKSKSSEINDLTLSTQPAVVINDNI